VAAGADFSIIFRNAGKVMSIWQSLAEAIEREPIPVLGIIFGCGAVTLIVAATSMARAWARVRASEAEATLKQEMIARGMNAEEIARVIQATAQPPVEDSRRRDRNP
jgi:hypothetical protein